MRDLLNSLDNSQIIQILGGLGVVISGLAILIGRLLNQRLLSNWQLSNETKVAELKGLITQNNLISSNLITMYGNNFQKFLDKRLEATEFLWGSILKLRNSIPPPISLCLEILHDEEFTNEKLNQGTIKLADEILKIRKEFEMEKLTEDNILINQFRIYLSDSLWLQYFVYRAFIGRTVHLLIKGVQENNILLWKHDKPLIEMLKYAMTEKEIKYILDIKVTGFYSTLDLLENKIMLEIKRFTSNDEITTDSLSLLEKVNLIKEQRNK